MTSPSPLERHADLAKEPPDARHCGFRPSKRYIVFQVLPDTLSLGPDVWRVLSKCHDMRNRTEYEGAVDVDERLVADLMGGCRKVAERVRQLPPIPEKSR